MSRTCEKNEQVIPPPASETEVSVDFFWKANPAIKCCPMPVSFKDSYSSHSIPLSSFSPIPILLVVERWYRWFFFLIYLSRLWEQRVAVPLLKQMCGMSLISAGGDPWVEASCILTAPLWKSKPLGGGVYSIVQVAIPDAGAGTPRQQRKHPVTNTHLFCGLLLAPYNDFIKYGCNHCHYFEMPTS